MQPIEALQGKIKQSELGRELIDNPLLCKDVWSVEELGYTKEESKILGTRNIYFEKFLLPWLKLLSKLTLLADIRQKLSLPTVSKRVRTLKQFDKFLIEEGYAQPELITNSLLQRFTSKNRNRQVTVARVSRLWTEEQWFSLVYIPLKIRDKPPQVKIIPEEVLYQIYQNLDLFPAPLERLFRLQIALGCRISDMPRMPRRCLKKEGSQWFLLRWVTKRKYWQFFQVHPAVAELVREQQKFLDKQLGSDSEFDKLFCKITTTNSDNVQKRGRFKVEPIYTPNVLSRSIIINWLHAFTEEANLIDKHGQRFNLTSHMFRRTKASVMSYCETEDEYIAAVLGHGSLDMLPHYRKHSLERLEKKVNAKGYVDMYGRVTSFTPRKRRYERLAELLKVSTPLGECHRPKILGDCQYRYACLSCQHHRVTKDDKPKIESDIECLLLDLEQSRLHGQERRVTEIKRLLELLKNRLKGLYSLEKLQNDNHD